MLPVLHCAMVNPLPNSCYANLRAVQSVTIITLGAVAVEWQKGAAVIAVTAVGSGAVTACHPFVAHGYGIMRMQAFEVVDANEKVAEFRARIERVL